MRTRARHLVSLLPVTAVAEAAFLRARRAHLPALALPDGGDGDGGDGPDPACVVWCVADGVDVPPAVRGAAIAHLDEQRLEALDLVPGDLPVDRLLELLRLGDPGAYRSDPAAPGRSAGQAFVLRRALADRLELDRLVADPDRATPGELARLAAQAKKYAPTACDLAVAPQATAGPTAAASLPELREAYGQAVGVRLALPLAQTALLAVGATARRRWAAAGVLALSLQPAIVVAGNRQGLAPRRLGQDALTHAVRPALRSARALATAGPSPDRAAIDAARPAYEAELACGTDRFVGAPRTACPWCEADELEPLIEVGDLLQQKPGRFGVDRCRACGHVFQNPPISSAGLSFYYRDFYDGLSRHKVEWGFQRLVFAYRDRVELVRRHTRPAAWLDVGGGHGHFCLIGRTELPDTRFEGLDQAESIVEAARRGWVDHAHQGSFVGLAPDLAGRFDVVSMHHYLEHTADPRRELDAAATVVPAGGHLLIEVPDPDYPLARRLGRWWTGYLQPQHLHLVPIDNLERALHERGFEVVDRERGSAHQPFDLFSALWTAVRLLAPPTDLPWLPPPTPRRRARQVAVFTLAAPALGVALVADHAIGRALRGRDRGNTYRVLARRRPA